MKNPDVLILKTNFYKSFAFSNKIIEEPEVSKIFVSEIIGILRIYFFHSPKFFSIYL